jgi:cytochrome c oxidase subunit 2
MHHNASNMVASVDGAMTFIVAVSVALLVLVTFFMIYFALRYSRARHPEAEEVDGNVPMEIAWTVLPTILVMAMFFSGFAGFKLMQDFPEESFHIGVTGRMWSWLFTYDSGRTERELILPLGRNVTLTIESKDVLHSLFIPEFRVKEDAVPGQVTRLWFTPEKAGVFDLFCTEYCGTGHSTMITKARVLPPEEFDAWYAEGASGDGAGAPGAALLEERGCTGCHSLDGTESIGPTLKGVYGHEHSVMVDGAKVTVTADDAYLVESMLNPQAVVVEGYDAIMPPGLVTEDEARQIIEFLKGGSAPADESGKGAALLDELGCTGCHSLDGTESVGPSLKGVHGRTVTVESGGAERTGVADDAYIMRAILDPGAEVVKGFPPIMPEGLATEEQAGQILEYLKAGGH